MLELSLVSFILLLGISKWVMIMMNVRTFKTKEADSSNLEEYRFVFLRYLDIAQDLHLFKAREKDVSKVESIWCDNTLPGNKKRELLQDHTTFNGEELLFLRYDLENSPEGVKRAIMQFYADYKVIQKQEKALWSDLTLSIRGIDVIGKYGKQSHIWIHNDAKEHRFLMTDDQFANKRIHYYRKALRDFSKKPCLPEALEASFAQKHGSLTDTMSLP